MGGDLGKIRKQKGAQDMQGPPPHPSRGNELPPQYMSVGPLDGGPHCLGLGAWATRRGRLGATAPAVPSGGYRLSPPTLYISLPVFSNAPASPRHTREPLEDCWVGGTTRLDHDKHYTTHTRKKIGNRDNAPAAKRVGLKCQERHLEKHGECGRLGALCG